MRWKNYVLQQFVCDCVCTQSCWISTKPRSQNVARLKPSWVNSFRVRRRPTWKWNFANARTRNSSSNKLKHVSVLSAAFSANNGASGVTTRLYLPWRFDLCQRPSSDEACSVLLMSFLVESTMLIPSCLVHLLKISLICRGSRMQQQEL